MDPGLFVDPPPPAVAELAEAWSWLVPGDLTPWRFTVMGDVFFKDVRGAVFWLDTGVGELREVSDDEAGFAARLQAEPEILMAPFVQSLRNAGKPAGPGQCYSPAVLPIFAEGGYTVDNYRPISARDHYGATGHLHRQINDLPEGAQVKLTVE